MQSKLFVSALLICLLTAVNALASEATRHIVIYDNKPTAVAVPPVALVAHADLWVTLPDLKRATGFVLKPQGVCRAQLCFPVPRGRRAAFLFKQGATTWFNLSEFARLLRQPVAYEAGSDAATWLFGPRPDEQNSYVGSLVAPNFTLPDKHGKMHSLADFRGKKVLLLTWASW